MKKSKRLVFAAAVLICSDIFVAVLFTRSSKSFSVSSAASIPSTSTVTVIFELISLIRVTSVSTLSCTTFKSRWKAFVLTLNSKSSMRLWTLLTTVSKFLKLRSTDLRFISIFLEAVLMDSSNTLNGLFLFNLLPKSAVPLSITFCKSKNACFAFLESAIISIVVFPTLLICSLLSKHKNG
ncbi:hypothetical protein BACERE00185_00117 [Bacillus mobilis]|uniref:Uncharacterized protein n=1 Tax=Bacillus mobilis TaxID=2026190 RepID=A0A1Y5YT95_9BACI|nr:hypothetical protein BACERE00185_00117 [Bacillus mobilis]